MTRRALLIGATVLLVSAAAVSLVVAVAMQPHQLPIEGPEQFSVLVAVRDIPVGTPAETAEQDGSFTTVDVRAQDIQTGALSSSEPLRGTVAAQTIPAGQQVLADQWVEPA